MRRMLLSGLLMVGCSSASEEATEKPAAPGPESRATEMPASLRCKQPADCVEKPSCYWTTPACVNESTVVVEKCSDDADPPEKRPKVECDCFQGQCTPK